MAWVQVQGAQQATAVQGACEEAARGGQGEANGADGGAAAIKADGGKDGSLNDVHISYDQLGEAAREHVAKCPHCIATNNQPMCLIGSLLAWGEIRAAARAAAADACMHPDQQSFPA